MSLSQTPDILHRPHGENSKRAIVVTNYLQQNDPDYNLHYDSDSDSETVKVNRYKPSLNGASYTECSKDIEEIQIAATKVNPNGDSQYTVIMGGSSYGIPEEQWANDSQKKELIKLTEPEGSPKYDFLTQFYIGSLTVVGLFILFRVIQKTR